MAVDTHTVSVAEMKYFDEWAIDSVGIPRIVLMENAGRAVADEIYNSYFTRKRNYDGVVIFCGSGNNGGDGLVAARQLLVRGIDVRTYVVGRISSFTPDSELNFRILRELGAGAAPLLSDKDVNKVDIDQNKIVVDALFGVGLNRSLSGVYKKAIDFMNGMKNPVISVDVPSGLNGTTGESWGSCVKATKTVTFVAPKKGFMSNMGKTLTGKIVVADIGIDRSIKN